MKHVKKLCLVVFALFLALGGMPGGALGNYPQKTITIMVPFSAGGGSDIWSRIMAAEAEKYFGQPWTVANVPGAGGILGWKQLLSKPADGYIIVLGTGTMNIGLMLNPNPALASEDIKIVAFISQQPGVLLAKPGRPWSTWEGLRDYAKKNPKKLVLGGTLGHLTLQANLLDQAGIELTMVPYPGAGKTSTDFLGGHIPTMCGPPSVAQKMIPERAVAVLTSAKVTHEAFKSVPTAKDLGFEGLTLPRWIGVHPDTPDEIADFISEKLGSLLKDPMVVKRVMDRGEEIIFLSRAEAQKAYDKMIEAMRKASRALK